MTVQTIPVPLPTSRRLRAEGGAAGHSDAAEPAVPIFTCSHAGACDQDSCGQAERVVRRCPSLEAPAERA